jgi:UDP-N-acetylmuramoyl-L-alanyl-D-glutamate--2,6-diaminopimelate ligase
MKLLKQLLKSIRDAAAQAEHTGCTSGWTVEFSVVKGSDAVPVTDICYDSRKLKKDALFVCNAGTRFDSHTLAEAVVNAGASVLVVEKGKLSAQRLAALEGAAVVETDNTRRMMALLAAAWYDWPARGMTMVGVTGTKGKTTTTHMIKAVCEAAGHKVGMVGTNGVYYPGHHYDLNNTTPENVDLQKILRQIADAGCDICVMEVSSQGLMMDRVAGIQYQVGVFTNLYPDHIAPGEHSSFEEYRMWKGQLFQRCTLGIVNSDDPNTMPLLQGHTCKLATYGIDTPDADYRADKKYELLRSKTMLGVAFHVTGRETLDIKVNMPGIFSIYNALATIAVARALGLPDTAIHDGLARAVVKGRVELVPVSSRFTILLDYAHNEAAAESLLETLKAYHPARMVVVFGCGGNRSKLRRYGMGEVCARMADFCILTEDNNRFEKIEDILADIRVGMQRGNPNAAYVEIPDRLDALHYALDHAQDGDLIAVIGKGHEAYRDRGGQKTPFLERELIEEYAAEKGIS